MATNHYTASQKALMRFGSEIVKDILRDLCENRLPRSYAVPPNANKVRVMTNIKNRCRRRGNYDIWFTPDPVEHKFWAWRPK